MNRKIKLDATGETSTFISLPGKSKESIELLVTLPASGEGPPAHRHTYQTEYFEAIEGRLGIDCGSEKITLEPGQSFIIPVNAMHKCYSIDGKEIKFKAVFNPALNIEYLLTEIFESCNRNNGKDPSLFDACHVLNECRGEYFFGNVPVIIQKTLFSAIAWLGKCFGLVKAKSIENFN